MKKSRNILDKTDRSLIQMPNGGTVLKRHKFNWKKLGKNGVFMWIPKESLNIDAIYQREVVSVHKVRKIASDWCPAALGTLVINQREDGTYWILDGGHRTCASFLRDDVKVLPCMVHQLRGVEVEQEARVFLTANTLQTGVTALGKHKAMIAYGDKLAIKVRDIVAAAGLKLTSDGNSAKNIKCVKTLSDAVHADEDLARGCLDLCTALVSDTPVSKQVFEGLFYLGRYVDDKADFLTEYGPRLLKMSHEGLKASIKGYCVAMGVAGTARSSAGGLLRVINKGRRSRKLMLPER